jgi:hypothetical protein
MMPTKKGHKKYIESPDVLWDLFLQYLENEKNEPYIEKVFVGKDGDEKDKPIMKHISFDGFEGYLALNNIIQDLGDYETNKTGNYEGYPTIIARIRKVCKGKLLTAAISGVANGNVVSRYLGLKELSENKDTLKIITVKRGDRHKVE